MSNDLDKTVFVPDVESLVSDITIPANSDIESPPDTTLSQDSNVASSDVIFSPIRSVRIKKPVNRLDL